MSEQTTAAPVTEAPVAPAEAVAPDTTVAEVAVTEAAPVATEAAPEAKKTDDFDARYASLTRKEGELVRAQQKLKAEREQYAKYEQAAKELEQLRAAAAENPVELLQKFGVKVEDVETRIAELKSSDPSVKLAREIEQMKREMAAKEQAAKEAEAARAAQQQVERHRKDTADFVKANAEKFELVATYGDYGVQLVQDAIIRHLQKTTDAGAAELLSFDQGCELVEKYLEAKYVEPALKTKKVASRIKPVEPAKAPEAPKTKTLTNEVVASTSNALAEPPNETDEERINRIARKFALLDQQRGM